MWSKTASTRSTGQALMTRGPTRSIVHDPA